MSAAPNLPPINAIRVFETAARLGNFTRTGETLGMTQAAVSYQVKLLEDRLGFALFERKARHVELTPRGARLARGTSDAFRLLERTFRDVREDRDSVLSVTALPTFCSNWLVPRIGAFQLENPQLAVRIDSRSDLVDIKAGEADIGIRIGKGEWPGLEARRLFGDTTAPLVSRAAAERFGPFNQPEDLLKLRLFGPMGWWRAWFTLAGGDASRLPERPALELETQTMEVSAAIASGDAATMVSPIYFAEQIASGALVAPFHAELDQDDAHYMVFDPTRAREPKIKAFIAWMLFQPMAFCLNRSEPAFPEAGKAVVNGQP
ncbi:LysR family transcriptional regulator [Maricaulis sp. W15]|uniref:LysR substrate-binding domain-containing protein n=1 Tax=Maricaulis sp. W15 TaxID=1772333 RepID=UPI000948E3AA|nr:LysR substrate-binding domain-containing protein [Maricaulis sp. W15]OLF71432.1 LysR family transcriptional regulator [Maricaulis sp. W15]